MSIWGKENLNEYKGELLPQQIFIIQIKKEKKGRRKTKCRLKKRWHPMSKAVP